MKSMCKHGRLGRICVILITCLMLVSLCACDPIFRASIADLKYADLFQVAAYSSFGVTTSTRLMGMNSIVILEEDFYGRILFLYRDRYDFSSWFQGCKGLFIVQKSEDDTVWFYEDFCYKTWGGTEEMDWAYVDTLKEKNDWEKPLNEKKMSKLEYDGLDYCLDIPHAEESDAGKFITNTQEFKPFLQFTSESIERSITYSYLCKDETDQRIFLACGITEQDDEETYGPYYIYLIRPDGSYECVEINSPFDCNQELHDLKVKNNWSGMPK